MSPSVYKLKVTVFPSFSGSPSPACQQFVNQHRTGLGVHVGIGNANRSLDSKMRVELVNFVFYMGLFFFFERVDAVKLLGLFNSVFI